MNDAGKVAFTPKGDYSSTVTYEYLDTVVYNGNAYAALKTTTGNAPADDVNEYWALLARGGTSIPTATEDTQGAVKASEDIGVDSDAKMVLKTDFAEQNSLTEIQSGESRLTFFGKIAKAVSDLISHVGLKGSSSVAGHLKISNSAAITKTGEYALDAKEKNASIDGTIANSIEKKAVKNHASSALDYGAGNATKYGHVKLSDNYQDSAGNAASSVGASSYAVAKAYQELVSAISEKVVVEDLSCTGLGYAWIYIPPRSGYKLANVYNGDRKFNEAKVTAFEYDGNNNIYDVYLDISQPTTNHILLRCIWVKD